MLKDSGDMKLLMFTCAGSYAVDQQTNAVSVFNIVERVVSPVYPCGMPDFHMVALFRRDQGGPDLSLRLVATLNAHTLVDAPFDVQFSNGLAARGFGRIGGLPIPEAGTLSFALWRGNQKWGQWTVEMIDATDFIHQGAPAEEPRPKAPAAVRRKSELLN
jgi:hypothetical protein